MTHLMKLAVIGMVTFAPATAVFAESGGTITGTIDGMPVSFQLRAGQSDWTDYGLSVMARNLEQGAAIPSIAFGFQKDGNRINGPELRLSTADAANGFRGDDGDGVAVNVTKWETDGETLTVTGAIGGPVLLVIDPVRHVYDQTQSHELDLIFDLTITNP